MKPTLWGVDQRLQQRYQLLVQEHTGQAHPTAAGPRRLPTPAQAKAHAQAAWRFFHNRRLRLPLLMQPLLDRAHQQAHQACASYRTVNGRRRRIVVPGAPLPVRLVVSQVRADDGRVLARWQLLTNLPAAVTAATVALWYYGRWHVESYFKLLKGAGQQREHWQQENAGAIVRRLLVASMACALVWRLARSEAEEAVAARQLLRRLSGRQLAWGKGYTEEALLAGWWVLVAMAEVLQERLPEDLRRLADFILAGSDTGSRDNRGHYGSGIPKGLGCVEGNDAAGLSM
jgi:hypothetical protein